MSPTAPASARPSARIVLVNWRQPDLTLRAARSLQPQLGPLDRLVIVDNDSGDGSVERLRAAGLDVIENARNAGFGAGVNLGARGLTEDALVLLNNDAVAEPGFLDAMLAPLGPFPAEDACGHAPNRVGATTALILLAGRYEPTSVRTSTSTSLTGIDGARWQRLDEPETTPGKGRVLVNSTGNLVDASGNGYDRDWLTPFEALDATPDVQGLCGGACAIRREAWDVVGGFREDLFMYYEDTDLSYRLRKQGWTIRFVREAVVLHEHAASSGTDSPMFIRVNTRNRILTAARHSSKYVLLQALARTAVRAVRVRGPVAEGLIEAINELPTALREATRGPLPANQPPSGYCVTMHQYRRIANFLRRGASYTRNNGTRMAAARILQGTANRLAAPPTSAGGPGSRSITKTPLDLLVRFSDAAAVDWTTQAPWQVTPRAIDNKNLKTAWIISPPGESSGGHQNIFRFISFLERAGHDVTVYLYTASHIPIDVPSIRRMVQNSPSYADVRASIVLYDSSIGVAPDTDVIVATGWETAYPAYLDQSTARRLYFVQDYEPYFYGVGSETKLAENTYRFGFRGITAGGWLAEKLHREYGMETRSYTFGTEMANYPRTNDARREDLFFYARPVTTRRGFEFGVMVLQEVKRLRPSVTIHMAGWDVSGYDIPFQYVNHGAMSIPELAPLYNKCAAALVMSLTNLSLLPLELLSCGTIPVVNDAPNNRLVSDNPYIAYVPLSPHTMAQRLIEILDAPDQVEVSRAAARSVAGTTWEIAGEKFIQGFEALVHE